MNREEIEARLSKYSLHREGLIAEVEAMIREAVAEEREACSDICGDIAFEANNAFEAKSALKCEKTICARGEVPPAGTKLCAVQYNGIPNELRRIIDCEQVGVD